MNRRENVTIIEDGIEIASPYPLCSKVELGKHTIIIHGREFPDAESLDWLADAVKEKLARQPDPITGLMPCGCGGKARIKHDGSYSSKCIAKNADGTVQYEGATVLYPGHTHAWVDCDNNTCKCSVGYCGGLIFKTDEEARDAWNRAMGWRADHDA